MDFLEESTQDTKGTEKRESDLNLDTSMSSSGTPSKPDSGIINECVRLHGMLPHFVLETQCNMLTEEKSPCLMHVIRVVGDPLSRTLF